MNQADDYIVHTTYQLCWGPWEQMNKAVIAHLTVFKAFTSLPLSKVSMWQHGQQRSSACQPLNKNSSCSPTIRGLLEFSKAATMKREEDETVSFALPSLPPSLPQKYLYPFLSVTVEGFSCSVQLKTADTGMSKAHFTFHGTISPFYLNQPVDFLKVS